MSAIKYPCDRCGKADIAERLIYSSRTGRRYCLNHAVCARRVAKLVRQGAEFDRGWLVG